MNDRSSASRMRAIGITQRATPLECAWTGELRVRFTDFQVNEIAENGKVVHLTSIGSNDDGKKTDTNLPEGKESGNDGQTPSGTNNQPSSGGKEQATKVEAPKAVPEVSPDDIASLSALAGDQFAQDVLQMYKNTEDPEMQKKKAAAEPTDDKLKRGQIHQEVRRIFQSKIDTSTDDSGVIVASIITRKTKQRGRGGRNNNNNNNREEKKPAGEYLHFTLYKDNRDTMDAVNQIARMLKVKPQVIGYAGTKDRRASTAQRCSVRYMRTRALAGTNSKLRGVFTGDYEYSEKPIRLGQLAGNEFVITIKECRPAEAAGTMSAEACLDTLQGPVKSALDHMAQHGWINYFGHQRFGTHGIGTHEIGKLILGEKYEEAAKSLLSYDTEIAEKAERGEMPDEVSLRDDYLRHQACMLFMTDKNYEKANQIIPRRFTAEVCVLRHLTRAGVKSAKDFVGALIHITRGLRTMYLHAYQSYVWNHVASRRWELHGEKVIKGDLVLVDADDDGNAKAPELDQDGGEVINPTEDVEDSEAATRARPLTEEEASSGRYTIRDVVLPSPGYDVILPDNDIGAFYAEFMARPENGALDPLKMRRIRREFSLPGRYRPLVNRFLSEPSIEFRTYIDDTEQMHPTDLDIIRAASKKRTRDDGPADGKQGGVQSSTATKKVKSEEQASEGRDEDVEMSTAEDATGQAPVADGEEKGGDAATTVAADAPKKVAAIVKFQLRSSAYATVTLRELMGDPPE